MARTHNNVIKLAEDKDKSHPSPKETPKISTISLEKPPSPQVSIGHRPSNMNVSCSRQYLEPSCALADVEQSRNYPKFDAAHEGRDSFLKDLDCNNNLFVRLDLSQPVAIDPDMTATKLDLLDNIAQSPASMDGRFRGLNSSSSTAQYSRPVYSNIQAKLRSEIRSVCSYGSMSGNVSEGIPCVDLQLCDTKFPLEQELDAVDFPPIEQETAVDDGDIRQECIPKHLLSQQSTRDHFEHGQESLTLVCGIEGQIDYTMNRWTYEIADANLPVAERLEKSHWETLNEGDYDRCVGKLDLL